MFYTEWAWSVPGTFGEAGRYTPTNVRFGTRGSAQGGESPRTKEDDYRKNAAETVLLAQRAATTSDKGRLLKLAEAWLDLADRARHVTRHIRRPRYLHPLIREKLDPYVDDA